jgi:hypothetical protein
MAHLDSSRTSGAAARKARRYRLVAARAQARGERIKRFSLSRADGLPRLERLEPATRSNPTR